MFFQRHNSPAPETIHLIATVVQEPSMNATQTELKNAHGLLVYQGRWGYYPCDYATHQEIKEYHKLGYRDFKATKRADRYYARLEKNRKGPIPRDAIGTNLDEYQWILEEYRCARHPKANPDEVTRLDLPRNWRTDLAALREHYSTT